MRRFADNVPKISVVVPSFNQGCFLSQALESVVGQKYPSLELIVMDGGSTDGSIDAIRRYEPHIHYWQSQADGGQGAAINAGMRRATGDLVCWLNSDDLFCDNALWTMAKAAAAYPRFGLYIANGFRLNERTKELTPFSKRSLGFDRRALRTGLDYVLQPATFFKRSAWHEVGGINLQLQFALDWDVIVRVSDIHPVLLINEFVAVSREHEETKTASGSLKRALEIVELTKRWAGMNLTPGAAVYLLEALRNGLVDHLSSGVKQGLERAESEARRMLIAESGNEDGFPHSLDPQDETYVPLAWREPQSPRASLSRAPLRISVITPSLNQAMFLRRAIKSLVDQDYPNTEIIVMDGGSTDASVTVLHSLEPLLTHWESVADRGPAHAINKGLAVAKGEILAWLNSDDMLAEEALWTINRAFSEDPELDMVLGNALYIDSQDRPILMDHGAYKTSLYYGAVQERESVAAYWSYIHSIPQPTVFFRRRLLEKCGRLDESYKFIFDFELFFRFMSTARLRKIEKTLAFYRIHDAGKTAGWNSFLVELYRFSRPLWPALSDPDFNRVLLSFTKASMRRVWGQRRRGLAYKVLGILVAITATTRLGNPEAILKRLEDLRTRGSKRNAHIPPEMRGIEDAANRPLPIKRSSTRYRVVFCSLFLPRYPGFSGGEIRDFHLLRELQRFCDITFVSLYPPTNENRCDPLSEGFSASYDPHTLAQHFPNLAKPAELRRSQTLRARLCDRMRRSSLPVLGEKLSRDPGLYLSQTKAYTLGYINSRLHEQDIDFLIVSPQTNPLGLVANRQENGTRFILATYDVEMVRLQRIRNGMRGIRRVGAQLEARRAADFERSHLRAFDGVIAVSDLDRSIFIEEYGIDPSRVLSLENGVDTGYFTFHRRRRATCPIILFTGSFGYRPNHDAAMRLVRRIMPHVWRKIPEAQLWIVGQQPNSDLRACSDGNRVFVTGQVESIRPHLQKATVYCAPLLSGSGTKYKILEALSSGVPIVCTPIAREGFDVEDGKHVIVAATDRTIAERIAWLVENPREADLLAETGRAFVEKVHDWERILFKLGPWLDEIARLPKLSSRGDVRNLYGTTEQTPAYQSTPVTADDSDLSGARTRMQKAHDENPPFGRAISKKAAHREAN